MHAINVFDTYCVNIVLSYVFKILESESGFVCGVNSGIIMFNVKRVNPRLTSVAHHRNTLPGLLSNNYLT
jgi:hypothetical protein